MVAAVSSDADGLSNYLDIFSKEYRRPIFFCALVTIAPILYGYDGTVRSPSGHLAEDVADRAVLHVVARDAGVQGAVRSPHCQ